MDNWRTAPRSQPNGSVDPPSSPIHRRKEETPPVPGLSVASTATSTTHTGEVHAREVHAPDIHARDVHTRDVPTPDRPSPTPRNPRPARDTPLYKSRAEKLAALSKLKAAEKSPTKSGGSGALETVKNLDERGAMGHIWEPPARDARSPPSHPPPPRASPLRAPAAPPPAPSPTTLGVKIFNLKATTTAGQVRRLCEKYGAITKVYLGSDSKSAGDGSSQFSFVTFEKATAARDCWEYYYKHAPLLEGRALRVEYAKVLAKSAQGEKGGKGKGKLEKVPLNEIVALEDAADSRDCEHITICCSNVSDYTTAHDLTDVFSAYGRVGRTVLLKDRVTGRSRGIAYVTFLEKGEAALAMEALGGEGSPLELEWAAPRKEKAKGGKKREGRKDGGNKEAHQDVPKEEGFEGAPKSPRSPKSPKSTRGPKSTRSPKSSEKLRRGQRDKAANWTPPGSPEGEAGSTGRRVRANTHEEKERAKGREKKRRSSASGGGTSASGGGTSAAGGVREASAHVTKTVLTLNVSN